MSGVLPVFIVTDDAAGCVTVQPQSHLQWGRLKLRKLDAAAKVAGNTGGAIPMTVAAYNALIAAGSVAA